MKKFMRKMFNSGVYFDYDRQAVAVLSKATNCSFRHLEQYDEESGHTVYQRGLVNRKITFAEHYAADEFLRRLANYINLKKRESEKKIDIIRSEIAVDVDSYVKNFDPYKVMPLNNDRLSIPLEITPWSKAPAVTLDRRSIVEIKFDYSIGPLWDHKNPYLCHLSFQTADSLNMSRREIVELFELSEDNYDAFTKVFGIEPVNVPCVVAKGLKGVDAKLFVTLKTLNGTRVDIKVLPEVALIVLEYLNEFCGKHK